MIPTCGTSAEKKFRWQSNRRRRRKMYAKFRLAWNHFWSNDGPRGDCFWWFDVILLIGGIKNARWKREYIVRYSVNCWFIYLGAVYGLNFYDTVQNHRDDFTAIAWGVVKTTTWISIALKLLIFHRFDESITELRNFITSKRITSGDGSYDEFEQRYFNQTVRTWTKAISGTFLVIAILLLVPNPATDKALGLPPQMMGYGIISSILYHFVLIYMYCLYIKFFSALTIYGTLLLGMRCKLRILVHRFKGIFVPSGLDTEQLFIILNREIKEALEQQQEYLRLLNVLKGMLAKTFIVIHYYSIIGIGSCLFVVKMNGMTFFSAALTLSASVLLSEYFCLCRLVDILQHETNKISDVVWELCAKMPHNRKHHSDYIQMRSTLMIIWINTQKSASMSCYGLFELSTLAFVDVVKTAYSVLTFLIGMG